MNRLLDRYCLQKCVSLLHGIPDYRDFRQCRSFFVPKFPTKRFPRRKYRRTKCLVVGIRAEYSDDKTSQGQALPAMNISFINKELERILQPLAKQPPDSSALTADTLHHLDAEYCQLLNALSDQDIINSLLFLYAPLKDRMAKLKLYNRSLEMLKIFLKDRIGPDALDIDSFVQLINVFGFTKEEEVAVAKLFFNRLPIKRLPERQLYMTLSSAFKAQILLTPRQVHQVEEILNTRCREVVGNPRLLVALCKVMRQAGPSGSENFQVFGSEILRRREPYNVAASAHVLAFFAEIRMMYPKVVERLLSDALNHYATAKNDISNPTECPLRDEASYIYKYKYLDTILWSTSRLKYNYKPRELDVVEKFVREHLPHLANQPNRLTNIMLSLWMLERRLEKELSACFEEGTFAPVVADRILWKPKARLCLLVNCIEIESSSLRVPQELLNDVHVGTEVPQAIQAVYQIVSKFSTQMKLKNVEMNCPIRGIFITGVSFRHMSAGSFHIDVLDNTNCLLPAREPDGLLKLKIRLLKKLAYHSIILDKNSLNTFEHTVTIIEARLNTIIQRR